LFVAFVQQRQIEQPFAGIVDDVERKAAIGAVLPLIIDHKPQLADIDGRVRPLPLFDQGADVVLIVEAGHGVVGLRLEPGAGDPAGGERLENRKAAAAGQPVNERRDEHGLAGARQPCDAEPHRRGKQMLSKIHQSPCGETCFLNDIGKLESHMVCEKLELAAAIS
jgi:hypothetical protein